MLFLFLFSLFISPLNAEETLKGLPLSDVDGPPSSIVGGCVNAITGDYFEACTDLVIAGPEPLIWERYYSSTDYDLSGLYHGWRHNYSSRATFFAYKMQVDIVNVSMDNNFLYYEDRSGSWTFFNEKNYSHHQRTFGKPASAKGYTNLRAGLASGKNHSGNLQVKQDTHKKEVTITNGAGEIHHFKKSANSQTENYLIDSEQKASGNYLLYEYLSNNKLLKVSTTNSTKTSCFNFIAINRPADHLLRNNQGICELISSDGRKVYYQIQKFQGTDRDSNPSTYRISKAYGNHMPTVSYAYVKKDKHEGLETYHMSKKTLPEGHFLEIDYFKKSDRVDTTFRDRVSTLRAPVGHDHTAIPTFTFTYDKHKFTTVLNAYKHKKLYYFDDNHHLTEIKIYNDDNQLHYAKTYKWNKYGNIEFQQLKDDHAKVITARYFTYDEHHNVLTDTTYGSLSGEIIPVSFIGIQPKGESWKIAYKYSVDGRNLLLEESLPNGRVTRYSYYPKSDLVASKLILDRDKICLRQFYEYDSNAVMITTIEDDGNTAEKNNLIGVTQRRITRYKPQRTIPLGLPQLVEEFYLDLTTNQEILLKRVENSYSVLGQLLKANHYASDGAFQYTLTWDYDAHGNVIKETNALGEILTRKFSENNYLLEETNRRGDLVKKHTYDFVGRLIATHEHHSDGVLLKTAYKYDYLNRLVETIDPYDHITKYTYDALDNQTATIFSGHTITKEFDLLGNIISTTDPEGYATLKKYNIRGQPVFIQHPDTTQETFVYNLDGTLEKHTLKNGSYFHYYYDIFGRVTKKELLSPNGELLSTTSTAYTPFNKTSETDAEGHTTYYHYDNAGKLTSMTKDDSLTEHTYDSWGRIASTKQWISDTTFKTTHFNYDALNRLIEEWETDSTGIKHSLVEYHYDADDHCIAILKHTEAGLQISKTLFNSQKQIILTTDPEGHQTHYLYNTHAYDKNGQRTLEMSLVDPLGNQTITLFNEFEKPELILKKNALGDILSKKELSYNHVGNLIHTKEIAIYQGQGLREVATLCTYNKAHQITSLTEAAGTKEQKITSYKYDHCGQKSRIIKPDGTAIVHTYDGHGRLKRFFSDDQRMDYTYSYNKNDDVIAVRDAISKQTNERLYDKNARLAIETLGTGFKIEYAYDRLGRPLHAKLADGSAIEYTYNCFNLIKIDRIKNNRKIYSHTYLKYDADGKPLKSQMAGQAGCTEYTYSLAGSTKNIHCEAYQESVESNSVGNITKCVSNFAEQEYTYDELYQLASETGSTNHTYAHDSLYNCIEKDNFSQTFNGLNQIQKTAKASYTYDSNGNRSSAVTNETKISYKYDALDRLVEIVHGQEKTIYSYDSFNRRLSKTQLDTSNHIIAKIHYIYFGQNEVGSFDENQAVKEFRVLGIGHGAEIGATVAIELENEVYVPINDHNGNIVALLDLEGNRVAKYIYSAFGEEDSIEGILSPWRFASKRFDEESGLIHFGRRYYDSSTATWLTPDPIGFEGGPNLYAYVLNSPLDHIDLYGLDGNWAEEAWDYCTSQLATWDTAMSLMKLPGVITEMVGYHLVPIPIIRDVIMMVGRTLQGQTPHFYINFNHSEYVGAIGNYHFGNDICTYINGILTSKEDAIARAQEISDKRNGEMVHLFYNASNGLTLDLLECLALKLGLPLEAPKLFAEMTKTLIENEGSNACVQADSHSQGGLITDQSLKYLTPDHINKISSRTFGSASMINHPHLRSSINYVSVGDPIPFLVDPLSIFKMAITYDRRIYFRFSSCFGSDHMISSDPYKSLVEKRIY